jgi:hypothetical protein
VSVVEKPTPARPADDAELLPTLQTYRRAMAQSPEALDDLLDRQAARDLAAAPPAKFLHPLTHSDSDLLDN